MRQRHVADSSEEVRSTARNTREEKRICDHTYVHSDGSRARSRQRPRPSPMAARTNGPCGILLRPRRQGPDRRKRRSRGGGPRYLRCVANAESADQAHPNTNTFDLVVGIREREPVQRARPCSVAGMRQHMCAKTTAAFSNVSNSKSADISVLAPMKLPHNLNRSVLKLNSS